MDLASSATGPFTPTDLHVRLARLAGRWAGAARTHLDPSDPEAFESAPWTGLVEILLGGRFVRFSYESHALGQPLAGELTLAYETGDGRLRMSWIDSLHTSPAILVSESARIAPDASVVPLVAHGTYFAGEGQPRWGWRTQLDDRTDGTLGIRMFNVTPDGDESLGVAVDLTRPPR